MVVNNGNGIEIQISGRSIIRFDRVGVHVVLVERGFGVAFVGGGAFFSHVGSDEGDIGIYTLENKCKIFNFL